MPTGSLHVPFHSVLSKSINIFVFIPFFIPSSSSFFLVFVLWLVWYCFWSLWRMKGNNFLSFQPNFNRFQHQPVSHYAQLLYKTWTSWKRKLAQVARVCLVWTVDLSVSSPGAPETPSGISENAVIVMNCYELVWTNMNKYEKNVENCWSWNKMMDCPWLSFFMNPLKTIHISVTVWNFF